MAKKRGAKTGPKRGANAARPTKKVASKPAEAGTNPYEVFQNSRRRRQVLGERTRGERRDLTKSRAEAANSRTRGLLVEKLQDRRSSRFKDGRVGASVDQGSGAGGIDEIKAQRLTKLRQRQVRKSFALGNAKDDDLTIGGMAVSGLGDEHLKKAPDGYSDDGEGDMDPNDPIALGKIRKAEEKQEQEQHDLQLSNLDADFGDILNELNFRPKKAVRPIEEKKAPDQYDRLMRELAFERKATATERTKTPQEIAREQVDKLEALERERVVRAGGEPTETRVADGSGDEAAAEDAEVSEPEGEEGTDGEGEEGEEEAAEVDEEVDEEAEEAAAEEMFSSFATAAKDDEDDEVLKRSSAGDGRVPLMAASDTLHVDVLANGEGEEGLPYALECPDRSRKVADLLTGHGPRTALKLVQRVRTCTAASLNPTNKGKLKTFFVALLDYLLSSVARSDGDISARGMEVLYALRPTLVDMANEFPAEAHTFFVDRLRGMGPSTLPKADKLCCLKLVAMLFPVTDFQHPITTPAAVLADHWGTVIAALGAGIEELVSDAMLLWEVLYALTVQAGRFCASFFKLGAALLETCQTSGKAGRKECDHAAGDVIALLLKALQALDRQDAVAARVAGAALLRPVAQKLAAESVKDPVRSQLQLLTAELDRQRSEATLMPLRLFETGPAQIRMLDPIFHEPGDVGHRGMERTETQLLKKKVSEARRNASRQLRRDAAAMQRLGSFKESKVRAARGTERTRVRSIMDAEKQMLKKMGTEVDGSMDTSIGGSYNKKKAEKKANARMGGNMTVDNKKPDKKEQKVATVKKKGKKKS